MSDQMSRRGALSLLAGTGLISATAVLSACSGTPPQEGSPKSGGSASGGDSGGKKTISADDYDAIIKAGPVADDSAIKASSWAQKIKSAGTLKRGGTDTSPIFSIKDPISGRTLGFDAGIGDLLAHYITGGDDVTKLQTLSQTTVDTRETMLQNNTVDVVVATYTITEERAKKIAFAGPYYSSGDAIEVLATNNDIKSYKDLAGKKIVTETNSSALTGIKKYIPDADVITFTENDACAGAVEDGRAVAYVLDQAILLSNVVKNPKLKVVGEPFTTDPYGIGVNKDDPEAKKFVDTFLKAIFDDGSWLKLWKATVGLYTDSEPSPPKIGSVPGS